VVRVVMVISCLVTKPIGGFRFAADLIYSTWFP
jgi:hypothetical protein